MPDGQISEVPVESHFQKYSGFRRTQITFRTSAIPSHSEGRFAIVTDAGRDAVDAAVSLTNDTQADGEVVWS